MPINTSKLVGDVMGSVLSVKVAGEMTAQKQLREADSDAADLENVENLLGNENNQIGEGSNLSNNLESATSEKLKAEQAMNEAVAKQGTASPRNEKGQFRKKADIEAENLRYDQEAADAVENYNQANDAYNQANDAMSRMMKQRDAWEKSLKSIKETIALNSKKKAVYANRMNVIRGGGNK